MEQLSSMISYMPEFSLGLGDDNDGKYFIHFSDEKQLQAFIAKNQSKMVTGHKCCTGKGLHIKMFDNKKVTDYEEIHRIKLEYS
tara:strand:+ start:75 stop:326 length:252 start_codon:yes stop_codon:yes gene_type:complete